MNAGLFPRDFPSELVAAAFVRNEEAAWRVPVAPMAVEWLSAHRLAVLGTELWLLLDGGTQSLPIGLSGKREVHGNTVNRERGEAWDSFVARSAKTTLDYFRSFNPKEIIEEGELYFNVVWVSEEEFEQLKA